MPTVHQVIVTRVTSNNWTVYVARDDGAFIADGLGWDEMLGHVVCLTMDAHDGGRGRYGMCKADEYDAYQAAQRASDEARDRRAAATSEEERARAEYDVARCATDVLRFRWSV